MNRESRNRRPPPTAAARPPRWPMGAAVVMTSPRRSYRRRSGRRGSAGTATRRATQGPMVAASASARAGVVGAQRMFAVRCACTASTSRQADQSAAATVKATVGCAATCSLAACRTTSRTARGVSLVSSSRAVNSSPNSARHVAGYSATSALINSMQPRLSCLDDPGPARELRLQGRLPGRGDLVRAAAVLARHRGDQAPLDQLGRASRRGCRGRADARLLQDVLGDRVPVLGPVGQRQQHQHARFAEPREPVLISRLSRHTLYRMA